jgi:hypothetical protein
MLQPLARAFDHRLCGAPRELLDECGAHLSCALADLLAEAPLAVLKGLVHEVGRWAQPGRVVENVRRVSEALGTERRNRRWLKDT